MSFEMNYVDRKFGHSSITWEIQNCCISPCDLDWTINSPDFFVRGLHITKWRMMMKLTRITDAECRASFELRRLDYNPYCQHVRTNCTLYFHRRFGKFFLKEFESDFATNSKYETKLENANVIPVVSSFHSHTLKLSLEILVCFHGEKEAVSTCTNLGIKKLSEDLHDLYVSGEHFDIKLKMNEDVIQAHKAILYHRLRNVILKEIISNCHEFTVDRNNACGAWDKVIRFLYTANMEYAVTQPTLSVYKNAVSFGVQPIIVYYEPEELLLYTTTEVEEFNFIWTVKDILSRREIYLLSPKVIGKMDVSCRFKIYPKGFGTKQEYMGVFVDIEGAPKDVCVEISLKHAEGDVTLKRIHKRIVGKEVFGNKNLIRRVALKDYIKDGSLTIGFSLRTATGAQRSSLGKSTIKYKPYSEQRNYTQLSEDMLSLYNDSKFRDFRLEVGENKLQVHRCILSVRHPGLFGSNFQERQRDISVLKVSALKDFFYFLYCGQISGSINLTNVYYLYGIAEDFKMASLQQALIYNLQRNLSVQNAADVHEFADSKNIESLKSYASTFVDNTAYEMK